MPDGAGKIRVGIGLGEAGKIGRDRAIDEFFLAQDLAIEFSPMTAGAAGNIGDAPAAGDQRRISRVGDIRNGVSYLRPKTRSAPNHTAP